VRNLRKGDNCGDGKLTRDADEGVLPTLCTGCEMGKDPFASGQKHSDSESSSSGRGADRDDEENLEGRKRRRKILFLRLRKKRRKVPLTWRSGQSSFAGHSAAWATDTRVRFQRLGLQGRSGS
jgi:hypothetical protein